MDANLEDLQDAFAVFPYAQKLLAAGVVAPRVVQDPLAGGLVVVVQDHHVRLFLPKDAEEELRTLGVFVNGNTGRIRLEAVQDEVLNRRMVDGVVSRYYLGFHLVLKYLISCSVASSVKALKYFAVVKICRLIALGDSFDIV